MSRKPSVILNASERKEVQTGLKLDAAAVKQDIADTKKIIKDETKRLKEYEKTLLGINTRLVALKPAPKPMAA